MPTIFRWGQSKIAKQRFHRMTYMPCLLYCAGDAVSQTPTLLPKGLSNFSYKNAMPTILRWGLM